MAANGQWGEWYVAVQELLDEDNTAWPVTLSMSSYGVAKRMFILEKIGKQTASKHFMNDWALSTTSGHRLLTLLFCICTTFS